MQYVLLARFSLSYSASFTNQGLGETLSVRATYDVMKRDITRLEMEHRTFEVVTFPSVNKYVFSLIPSFKLKRVLFWFFNFVTNVLLAAAERARKPYGSTPKRRADVEREKESRPSCCFE